MSCFGLMNWTILGYTFKRFCSWYNANTNDRKYDEEGFRSLIGDWRNKNYFRVSWVTFFFRKNNQFHKF